MTGFVARFPMPPTTNNLFAGNGNRRYRTAEYQAWAKEAGWLLAAQRFTPVAGPFCVLIEVGEPKGEKQMDLANREKAAIDLLVEHGLIQGDNRRYLRELTMRWADLDGIRVTIRGL